MAMYDDYFRSDDKPFAENLNDALLLSNVFDLTVGIEMPKMFSNSSWVNTTSPRKCSVAILTLKEGLPTGVTVSTDSDTGNSVLTGTGTVKLSFYPNFNAFGKYNSMTWESDGSIVVNLKTDDGSIIVNNINNGDITSASTELQTLKEIVIEIVMSNATLKSFEVVMENKQAKRYGATVGISDVTGLNATITNINSEIEQVNDNLDASISNIENKLEVINSDIETLEYDTGWQPFEFTGTKFQSTGSYYRRIGKYVTLYLNFKSTEVTNYTNIWSESDLPSEYRPSMMFYTRIENLSTKEMNRITIFPNGNGYIYFISYDNTCLFQALITYPVG